MPADLQLVAARDQAGDAVGGQVPGDGAGQRAEPGALRLHDRHAALQQGRGGDRAHARRDDGAREGRQQRLLQSFGAGRVQHRQDGRGAGEGHGVHAAGDRLTDQAAQRRGSRYGSHR
nr:hypothetical protein GCM10020093_027050 [Planobispora longispora]